MQARHSNADHHPYAPPHVLGRWRNLALAMPLAGIGLLGATQALANTTLSLADLSLEQLSSVRVTSVSRRPEPLSTAAASVFVITREDIRRAGTRTLLDTLALAPNLHVARLNGRESAVSARGFNSTAANKLLVLLDGRSLYTPLFSGVSWDLHDVVLADVERIEVISGPGATLWGSNAINGVINIITRNSRDTLGTLLSGSAGETLHGIAARHGAQLSNGASFRVYAKQDRYAETERANGTSQQDAWHKTQAGFRVDGGDAISGLTVSGDAYRSVVDRPVANRPWLSGANLLMRWQGNVEGGRRILARMFYDGTRRDFPGVFQEELDIVDVLLQQDMPVGTRQNLILGVNYRHANDRTANGPQFAFIPADRRLNWASLYAQDDITLSPATRISLGMRAEYNVYTHWEWLPSLRIGHTLESGALLWGAISRSVRAPSRIDREFFSPAQASLLAGGPDFESEVSDSVEAGYRAQIRPDLSVSLTAFHHRFDGLRGLRLRNGRLEFDNGVYGHTYGLEGWTSYAPFSRLRLDAGFTRMRQNYRARQGSFFDGTTPINDPKYQWQVRSTYRFSVPLSLTVGVRHVARLPAPEVPSWTTLNIRAAYTLLPGIELSLNVENALDDRHREFGTVQTGSEFGRSAWLGMTASF